MKNLRVNIAGNNFEHGRVGLQTNDLRGDWYEGTVGTRSHTKVNLMGSYCELERVRISLRGSRKKILMHNVRFLLLRLPTTQIRHSPDGNKSRSRAGLFDGECL